MGETKMLVVVLLLVIIFLGIAAFLFYIEKRLQKAEQEIKSMQEQEGKQKPGKNTGDEA